MATRRTGADEHRYRRDIDGLRAVSILAVVGYHAGIPQLAGGYVGVDVFFVVSGFLITGLLVREHERSGTISLREFYARRIRRLLPLSAAVLITTLLLGAWLVAPTARRVLVDDARAAALYVANWRYAGQATAYSDTNVEDGLLVHYWSLAIEEQFYVVWPLLVLLAGWVGRRSRLSFRPTLGVTLVVLIAASFVASVVTTASAGPEAYFVTHTRIWELSAGALLAVIAPRLPGFGRGLGQALGGVGIIGIVLAVLMFDETTPFPGSAALLPVIATLLLISSGRSPDTMVARTLSLEPFVALGRLSYAWYLIHWPAIGIMSLLRQRYAESFAPWLGTATAVALSLGLAWLANRYIENPVRRHRALTARIRPNLVLGVTLSVLPVAIGAITLATVDLGEGRRIVQTSAGVTVQTMSPAQAADDTVDLGPECHNDWSTVELARPCTFGADGSDFVIALVGDSHARQWLPAFDRLGRTEGWEVRTWTKSACSIIDAPVFSTGLERSYDECADWRQLVFDELNSVDDVDLVVLARAASSGNVVMRDGRVIDGDVTPEWTAGVESTLVAMTEAASEVVLLADTPWAPGTIPDCLSSTDDPSDCAFGLDGAVRDSHLIEIETPIADRLGVRIVDPVPLICPEGVCPAMTQNGVITYRDTNHLTVTFTHEVAVDLANAILAGG